MRTKTLLLAAVALAALTQGASAAQVTLCSGRAGGGYDGVMQAIGAALTNKGVAVSIINEAGSEDILGALADGQCSYGPAQKDVHYSLSKSSPATATKVTPIAVLYNEAMTMVCTRESGYDELSDIQEGDSIIVDALGSGSALTWDTMVGIEKEFGNGSSWSKAKPVYTPLDEAAAALSLGQAKCAFGVGKVPIDSAADLNNQGDTLSWVYDKDINDLEFNGSSLYEPERIPAGSDAYSSKFDTYKVGAVLFRSNQPVDAGVDKLIKRLAPTLGRR